MQPGAPSFYPGASPTEFGTYGKQGRESGESESQGVSNLTNFSFFLGLSLGLKMIGLVDSRDMCGW